MAEDYRPDQAAPALVSQHSAPLTRFLVCLLAGHAGGNLLAGLEQATS